MLYMEEFYVSSDAGEVCDKHTGVLFKEASVKKNSHVVSG